MIAAAGDEMLNLPLAMGTGKIVWDMIYDQPSVSRIDPAGVSRFDKRGYNVNIRTVQKGDIKACHRIEQACFESGEAASLKSIQERAAVYPDGFIVAEIDHSVVGMVNSGSTDSDDITDEAFKKLIGHTENGKNIVVFSVSVLPEFQGKGIASALMKQFIKRAGQLKKVNVLLLCKTDLIPFYKRLGFEYGGISDSTHGGSKWHEMVFRLSPMPDQWAGSDKIQNRS